MFVTFLGTERGLYDYCYFMKGKIMKDIGQKLKEKREENGVSIEEASEDLKMRPSQIASIEEGNTDSFKDMYTLKYFVRDYAKYLGLETDKIMDEFNEFMFDFTSKIPVEAIEKAKKEKKDDDNKITSPYTTTNTKVSFPKYIIAIIAVIIVLIVAYFVVSGIRGNDFNSDNVTYAIRRQ